MYHPYAAMMTRAGRPDVVPRELAQRIAAERDQLARELVLARRELEQLRREVDHQQRQLEHITIERAALREQLAAAPSRDDAALEQLRAQVASLESQLQAQAASSSQASPQASSSSESQTRQLALEAAHARQRERRELLISFLSLRDHLTQALSLSHDPHDPWRQGIEGIVRQFDSVLERHQVSRFGLRGEDFDPRVHEAIGVLQDDELPEGKLARVERPGFRFEDGALARAAQVIVSAPPVSTEER